MEELAPVIEAIFKGNVLNHCPGIVGLIKSKGSLGLQKAWSKLTGIIIFP